MVYSSVFPTKAGLITGQFFLNSDIHHTTKARVQDLLANSYCCETNDSSMNTGHDFVIGFCNLKQVIFKPSTIFSLVCRMLK